MILGPRVGLTAVCTGLLFYFSIDRDERTATVRVSIKQICIELTS